MERLEQFVATRQKRSLLPEQGTATATIQMKNDGESPQFPLQCLFAPVVRLL